jgi:Cu-Zn family superoxide dismutase
MNSTLRRIAAGVAGIALAAVPATQALACPARVVVATGTVGITAYSYDAVAVPAGATISVRAVETSQSRTVVTLRVRGLAPNRDYGAHAHQRACGPAPTDAGAHFQHVVDPVQPSVDPRYANPRNEIWLDLTTNALGDGSATAVVGWGFDSRRAGSVVLHDHHTATEPGTAGTAGPRLGCLTVPF